MSKCTRHYVAKRMLQNMCEWLILTGICTALLAAYAGIRLAVRWLDARFPNLVLCILLGLLWLTIAMTVHAVKEKIAKLTAEARRECGE